VLLPLLAEFKRRRVFRALIAYGIAAFAVLQVSEPVSHALHLPEWTLTFMVVALGAGFPIVILLAWAFDVSPSASSEPHLSGRTGRQVSKACGLP